jgi:hypothetical protein
MDQRDFIICAPILHASKSNGILALAELARSIEKTGRAAFICVYARVDNRDVLYRFDFESYVPQNEEQRRVLDNLLEITRDLGVKLLRNVSQEYIDECYVVYPETLDTPNPLNAKRVIRYFLNKDGVLTGNKVAAGPHDFILAHSRVTHPNPHHVCYFAHLNPVFNNTGTDAAKDRKIDLTYIGKGELYGVKDAVPGTVLVTRSWPDAKDQLAILLRNCRFFYSADACSNLNMEALACGAIPAFLDVDEAPWTDEEVDGFEQGPLPRLTSSTTFGENFYAEFEASREAFLARYRELVSGWEASVRELVEKVDRHFSKPHTPIPALQSIWPLKRR